MTEAVFRGQIVPILHGDGRGNDRPALHALFNGRPAFDKQVQDAVLIPGIRELPPGWYRLIPLSE